MHYSILIFSFLIFLILFPTCNRKQYICPAYTTYFMHDDKERDQIFMPFRVDSLYSENEELSEQGAPDTEGQLSGGKYKIKQETQSSAKKNQIKGLVINQNGKGKVRNNKDIEMRFVAAKPMAQFMNVDSSSLTPKQTTQDSL